MPIWTYLISMNSSKPYLECSRPSPDCFIPPKGAISLVMPTSLTPIIPYSNASAVFQVLARSCTIKVQLVYLGADLTSARQVCLSCHIFTAIDKDSTCTNVRKGSAMPQLCHTMGLPETLLQGSLNFTPSGPESQKPTPSA